MRLGKDLGMRLGEDLGTRLISSNNALLSQPLSKSVFIKPH